MTKLFCSFRSFASRFKFVSALLAVFLSGMLFCAGGAAWYYGNVVDKINYAHDEQVRELRSDILQARTTNRKILDQLTDQVGVAVTLLKQAAATAQQAAQQAHAAATTATHAATTANHAAVNAANANIVETVTPPAPKHHRNILQPEH
jgi:hypothetical protein